MSVESAQIRLAEPEEVAYAKGGYLWQGITAPWNLLNKILGTCQLVFKTANVLAWESPAPLRLLHWVTWRTGWAPHNGFIKSIPTFGFDFNQITDEKVIAAFFKLHRNDDIFSPSSSFEMILGMLEKTFPETTFNREDLIFTCTPENTKLYHQLFAGPMHGEEMKGIINEEVKSALEDWTNRSKNNQFINITSETRLLASRIITRVLLGQKNDDRKLCDSINFINLFMIKTYTRRITDEDTKQFQKVLIDFREATNAIVDSHIEIPLFGKKDLSKAQKQALVFVTLFAGQETVASLLNNMFYDLAIHSEKRESLQKDTVKDIFTKAIHDFPPAYGVGRKLKNDVCITYTLKGEETERKVVFFKGQQLSARMISIAEAIPIPEEGPLPDYTRWQPFGGGPHSCPGKTLAVNEVEAMVVELKKGYKIKLSPEMGEVTKLGLVTLQLSEDIYASIEKL